MEKVEGFNRNAEYDCFNFDHWFYFDIGYVKIIIFFKSPIEVSFIGTWLSSIFATILLGYGYAFKWMFDKRGKFILHSSITLENLPEAKNELKAENEAVNHSLKLAHLSDLHIPEDGQPLTENQIFPDELFLKLCKHVKINDEKLDAWLITGDITDTGTDKAWGRFKNGFSTESFITPVIFAPGNHDLNMVGFGAMSLFLVTDNFNWSGRLARISQYFEAANLFMGQSAHVLDSNNKLKSLSDALKDIDWEKLKSDTTLTSAERYAVATNLFPFVIRMQSQNHSNVCFVIWNSNRPTAIAINNSFGTIDVSQLQRFKSLSSSFETSDLIFIHLLHHKLAVPNSGLTWEKNGSLFQQIGNFFKTRVQLAGMMLENPSSFLSAIDNVGQSQVVLHGHHHSRFAGILKRKDKQNIYLVSAPSTTLGAESWDKKETKIKKCGYDILFLNMNSPNKLSSLTRIFKAL